MIILIFAVAAGCIVAERLWPAMELPRVRAWWPRVLLINAIQLGITLLAGQTWNRWLAHASLFHFSQHLASWSSALIVYVFSTFVYYWWHRYRHESQFLWRTLHQIHHSARRLEILTSFYKHPVEIWINSLLSSVIVFPLFGCSVEAAGYYTLLIALGEFFYHWNIKTPRWLGYFFQRPSLIASTISSGITPIILVTCRSGTSFSALSGIPRNSADAADMKIGGKIGSTTWSRSEMSMLRWWRHPCRCIFCRAVSAAPNAGRAARLMNCEAARL